jgi:putative colanic acid biosynthesis UDP-glucose lipid carrier transferase
MRKSLVSICRTIGGLLDGLLLVTVYILADRVYKDASGQSMPNSTLFWLVILFLWFSSSMLTDLYRSENWLSFTRVLKATIQTFFLMTIGVFVVQIWVRPFFSLDVFVWMLFVCFLFLFSGRLLLYLLWYALKDRFTSKILLIGEQKEMDQLMKSIRNHLYPIEIVSCIAVKSNMIDLSAEKKNGYGVRDSMKEAVPAASVLGFVGASREIAMLRPVPEWRRVNGSTDSGNLPSNQQKDVFDFNQVLKEAGRKGAREIYCTVSPEKYPALYELARLAERAFLGMKFIPSPSLFVRNPVLVDELNGYPVLSLRPHPLELPINQFLKRSLDISVSVAAFVFVLWWLMPILALIIWLDSPGPVFFVQWRSGKNNRPFRCFKFRTLRNENHPEAQQVTQKDNRVTRVGRFLRKSNLDELPQFFNVFIGDMSAVGPRPHMIRHTETFDDMHTEYMVRHLVKPGVTGLAQINGYRGEIRSPDLLRKRVDYDIRYLENWSIREDIRILFATIWVSLKGDKNAY